jgi:nitrile hydratase subunit beta
MGGRSAGSEQLTTTSGKIFSAALRISFVSRDTSALLRMETLSMNGEQSRPTISPQVVYALGERPVFKIGDRVRVDKRLPVGHYRVPTYLRGKTGVVETVIEPVAVDNEQEGFGRNAGGRRHYYRIAVRLNAIWDAYKGSPRDCLYIEVFETWLERI